MSEFIKPSGEDDIKHNELIRGAQVLSTVNFQNSHQDIVQSSFDRARNRGDKIEGERPNTRRNYAYLNRLEKLVEKYGNSAIQKLCRLSATKLIVKPNDISDKYWERENKRSIKRGDGELTAEAKEEKIENIQEMQKRSVEKWSNYLGNENSPFPIWFKAYAFDGISKMGRYDGDSGIFSKRRKGDISSYPNLNEAALSQTYQAVVAENGNNPDVEQLVKNGNFNKLYSKFYTEQNRKFESIEIPERAEEVQGKWVEYGVEHINELFTTSSLNGCWCIGQDFGILEGYFDTGHYIADQNRRFDAQENLASDLNNKSKFILFHPTDPEKSEAVGIPVVSIRLDRNGEVAEISGIMDDDCDTQILNDSLVPEVKQKVLSLPGGERYKIAFDQREKLIDIRKKLNADERLTGDDLSFLWNPKTRYHHIGMYEDFKYSSKLLDTKEKTKEMFINDFTHNGEYNRGAVILADILEEYGLSKSAELIPQIAVIGIDLATLAEWPMRPNENKLDNRFDKQQILFGNTLLENGLPVRDLFIPMSGEPSRYKKLNMPQDAYESNLLSYGISPKSILESMKKNGKKGRLSIEAYSKDGLTTEQILPFIDLTDYKRWIYEMPSVNMPDDIETRRLFDQTAIEQFKENYEREKWFRPDNNDNAFTEFIRHLKREKEQYGYLGHIDDIVEIARDPVEVNTFLECGANPDEVLNKLIEFASKHDEELDDYVNLENLLDSCRRRGRGLIMPDYIVSLFSPEFVARHAYELMSDDFGASVYTVSKYLNSDGQ